MHLSFKNLELEFLSIFSFKKAKEKSTNFKTNIIKTHKQLIKKSNSVEKELSLGQAQIKLNQEKFSSYSTDESKSKINYEFENNANDFTEDNDDLTMSSSGSSSISRLSLTNNEEDSLKETVRLFAQAASRFDANSNRVTIDLSNDPDIKKFFEDSFVQDETHKIIHPEANLIDVSDSQKTNLNNIFDDNNKETVDSSYFQKTQFTSSASSFSSIANSTILSPSKPEDNLKSIIDEFDPLSTSRTNPESSQNFSNAINRPFFYSNISNITPKPFQAPSYNASLPPVANLKPSVANGLGSSQSYNSIKQTNAFSPTPFYSQNFSNLNQNSVYRPVQFINPSKMTATPNLPLGKTQISTNNSSNSNFNNQQKPQDNLQQNENLYSKNYNFSNQNKL